MCSGRHIAKVSSPTKASSKLCGAAFSFRQIVSNANSSCLTKAEAILPKEAKTAYDILPIQLRELRLVILLPQHDNGGFLKIACLERSHYPVVIAIPSTDLDTLQSSLVNTYISKFIEGCGGCGVDLCDSELDLCIDLCLDNCQALCCTHDRRSGACSLGFAELVQWAIGWYNWYSWPPCQSAWSRGHCRCVACNACLDFVAWKGLLQRCLCTEVLWVAHCQRAEPSNALQNNQALAEGRGHALPADRSQCRPDQASIDFHMQRSLTDRRACAHALPEYALAHALPEDRRDRGLPLWRRHGTQRH